MNNHEHVLNRASDDATRANAGEERQIAPKARRAKSGQSATVRKPERGKRATRSSSPKPDKSKKDQLIALLSKPNGARVSVLVDRLGWQAHTVRAALSGLRKQGLGITTSKSTKTGEAVYAIAARPEEEAAGSDKELS